MTVAFDTKSDLNSAVWVSIRTIASIKIYSKGCPKKASVRNAQKRKHFPPPETPMVTKDISQPSAQCQFTDWTARFTQGRDALNYAYACTALGVHTCKLIFSVPIATTAIQPGSPACYSHAMAPSASLMNTCSRYWDQSLDLRKTTVHFCLLIVI